MPRRRGAFFAESRNVGGASAAARSERSRASVPPSSGSRRCKRPKADPCCSAAPMASINKTARFLGIRPERAPDLLHEQSGRLRRPH